MLLAPFVIVVSLDEISRFRAIKISGFFPIWLEGKRFLSKKGIFSMGSANRTFPLMPIGPMPGQKSIRLAKKGGDPSLLNAGFRRFQPGHPFPPASRCGEEAGGNWEGLIPALFGFGACPFARATRGPA